MKPGFRLLFTLSLYGSVVSCTDNPETDPKITDTGIYALSDSGKGGETTSSGTGGGGSEINPDEPGVESGVITAAEWNDLEHWDFWRSLLQDQEYAVNNATWNFKLSPLYRFVLTGNNGVPLADAAVVMKGLDNVICWRAHTDNSGQVVLWPAPFGGTVPASLTVSVTYAGQTFFFNPAEFSEGTNARVLPVAGGSASAADVMFVVDATGSMGDELEYLKNELYDVLQRAGQQQNIQLRTGAVFYRDTGDEYVTRVFPFTGDFSRTVDFVKEQHADGGGDYEEAVEVALRDALEQQDWSDVARARLLFLVLDAPPHNNEAVKALIRSQARKAAEKGIKIIPVSASGIDKTTEFLLRNLSIATNGTYVFITDDSGVGASHLQPTVGEYEVEYLNDLMVRLIRKYTDTL